MKPYIIVLGGGNSPERAISLRSAAAVNDAALQLGYKVSFLDPVDGYTALDKVPPGSVVLPILHGVGGEDGVIQRELEARNLKYLGSNSKVSAICIDKDKTRKILIQNFLPVAIGEKVNAKSYSNSGLKSNPHVLKACTGGSSLGTLIVKNPSNVSDEQIAEVFKIDKNAVIEELISGVEITIPVLGETPLPVIEIEPPEGLEFDYVNKYNGATNEFCPPKSISKKIQTSAQQLALKTHVLLGCRHISRTDMIVRNDGTLVILEINTMPGLTSQSLFPKSAKANGMSFNQLVNEFINMTKNS